jgi:glyoxylase-like metal-dependent hydrolase (beta-lactamase superfamily II)
MKLADGIHYLSQKKGGHVHAFLLDDGTGITLIDALFDTDAKMILAEIAAMGRQPPYLKHIIATHAHRSHIGGLAELKRQAGPRCMRTSGRSGSSRGNGSLPRCRYGQGRRWPRISCNSGLPSE